MRWVDVCPAALIPCGGVHGATVAGREMVVWRTSAGHLVASDAYCPHLGAHLARGGTVEGEHLVCPFHGWRFGPDGSTVGLGYPGRCPSSARAVMWPVEEQDGRVRVSPPREGERVPQVPRWGRFPQGWYKLAPSDS